MASKTAILAVRIVGDASSAVGELDKVSRAAEAQEATMRRVSAGSAIALGAIAAAAVVAGNAAAEAEQATGALESVFDSQFGKMQAYAEAAAEAVGLSSTAYSNSAAVLGSQLKNMGVSADQIADQTNSLITLGADLASMFGGTTSDAVSALSSLLRGERDPIERYGVSINQAAIDAQKAAMGLTGLSGEAEKNANLQATLALLTQQTADATGNFAREADTAQGQQQRANAAWQNASAQLGEALLPLMTAGAQILADWAQWASENERTVYALAGAIGGLAAGFLIYTTITKAFAAAQAIQTAAQWASNAAWLASPVTWIILAIIAAIALLVAAGIWLVQNWDTVQAAAGVVFGAISDWWNDVVQGFTDGIDGMIGWIQDLLGWLGQIPSSVVPGWLKDTLNLQFSADYNTQATTAAGQAWPPAPGAMLTLAAMPSTYSTISDYGSSVGSSASTATVVNNTYEINVSGAIDPNGTARTVLKALNEHGLATGTAPYEGRNYR